MTNTKDVVKQIQEANNDEKITITVQRGISVLDIEFVPDKMYTYYLGVTFKTAENNLPNSMHYALYTTRDFVLSVGENLKSLFKGNVGIDQMMGPVGISEVVAKTEGFREFINMMALISLSLGITNLLPFPALDGGKFVLLIIEAIRGKKISQKVEINLTLIGFSILILLSLYVTYNDILRIF